MTINQSFGRGCRFLNEEPCECVQLLPSSMEEAMKEIENRRSTLESKVVLDQYLKLCLTNRLARYCEIIESFYDGESQACNRKLFSSLVDPVVKSCGELRLCNMLFENCSRCDLIGNQQRHDDSTMNSCKDDAVIASGGITAVSSSDLPASLFQEDSCTGAMSHYLRKKQQSVSVIRHLLGRDIVNLESLEVTEKWKMQNKLFCLLQDVFNYLSGNCLNCFFSDNKKLSPIRNGSNHQELICEECHVAVSQSRKAYCFFCNSTQHVKQNCMLFKQFAFVKQGFKARNICFSCLCPVNSLPLTIKSNRFHQWLGYGTTNIGPNCNCKGRGIVEISVFRYLLKNELFMTDFMLTYGSTSKSEYNNNLMQSEVEFLGRVMNPYDCIGSVVCLLHFYINF